MKKNKGRISVIRIISAIVVLLTAVASVLLYLGAVSLKVLPDRYLTTMLKVLIPFNLFFGFIGLYKNISTFNRILQIVICTILSAAMIAASIVIPNDYKGRIEKIFTPIPETSELYLNVYVLKDAPYTELTDLAGKRLGIQKEVDREHQNAALEDINKMMGDSEPIIPVEINDIYSAAESLFNGTVDAIIMNGIYADILSDNADFSGFINDTRIIYFVTQEVIDEHNKPVPGITNTPFVVGIAGNDTYDYSNLSVNARNRTDVNIVVGVNPNTKQILLITIPRDSYLGLGVDNEKKDKLTHASVYGIGTWIKTINYLLDCEINYYVRVNFSSLIDIVDALGGIEIDNPYAFRNDGDWISFPKGIIHLDGKQALSYARERKSLSNGDMGRNEHQAIVLRALINKLMSKDNLTRIDSLLSAFKGKFATDMTMDEIYELVKMQLDDMAKWTITTYSITGTMGNAPSYAYGGRELNMVFLNEISILDARKKLKEITYVEE
ncbi:MAG: LCP family protein [Erysipelotrichaceae bacterium]|nr:LCP family protein [Erysipelotrichaceae bacterium]